MVQTASRELYSDTLDGLVDLRALCCVPLPYLRAASTQPRLARNGRFSRTVLGRRRDRNALGCQTKKLVNTACLAELMNGLSAYELVVISGPHDLFDR